MSAVLRFPGKLVRRPESKLTQACPTYRRALDAFQAAMECGDEPGMAKAWDDATLDADASRQGVAFALEGAG